MRTADQVSQGLGVSLMPNEGKLLFFYPACARLRHMNLLLFLSTLLSVSFGSGKIVNLPLLEKSHHVQIMMQFIAHVLQMFRAQIGRLHFT